MNLEEEQDKIIKFIKAGLVIMSAVLLLAIGQRVLPEVVTASASAKKLPIYCVDTEEKKVALSFDAAWGNGWLGHLEKPTNKECLHILFLICKTPRF